ncbi:hypothetical protein A2U01_0081671, partial [Trifolium medium]|nr:hypothetical protein [Trifolium medium]
INDMGCYNHPLPPLYLRLWLQDQMSGRGGNMLGRARLCQA